ncbi:MAG: hypothetical protein LBS52_00695 [Dysgonamonadaceae bacterium]|jgi:hypothetical protein|nr:hypothetical protein [Dysgonamonadaceae bacterium]
MNPKIRQLLFFSFALAIVATIVVYIATDRNMKYTWLAGGITIVLYLINRFSK